MNHSRHSIIISINEFKVTENNIINGNFFLYCFVILISLQHCRLMSSTFLVDVGRSDWGCVRGVLLQHFLKISFTLKISPIILKAFIV